MSQIDDALRLVRANSMMTLEEFLQSHGAEGLRVWCALFNAGKAMVCNGRICLTPEGERYMNRRNAA